MAEPQTYHGTAPRRPGAFALLAGAAAAAALLAAAWAWWRPFRARVEGDSMEPALRDGDALVATRRGRIRPGTIVVAEHPGRPGFELVKRVRYCGGAVAPDLRRLSAGELWIEGDRPERSTDSRHFGPIARSSVRGVVRFRYAGAAEPLCAPRAGSASASAAR